MGAANGNGGGVALRWTGRPGGIFSWVS
jgi:hypothetical protein